MTLMTNSVETEAGTLGLDIRQFYSYNLDGKSGTFDGTVYGAGTGITTLNSIWIFHAFDKLSEEAVGVDLKLPSCYVDGRNIEVVIPWTVDTASKTVRWMTMLTGKDGSSNYGADADAEHIYSDEATAANWPRSFFIHTHSGTGLVSGDEVNIILGRDAAHANDDLNGDAYARGILIRMAAS